MSYFQNFIDSISQKAGKIILYPDMGMKKPEIFENLI